MIVPAKEPLRNRKRPLTIGQCICQVKVDTKKRS